jgi:ribonucleoside-diphosphate reductase beta chain
LLAGYRHLLEAGRRLQWDAEAIDLSRDRAALATLGAEPRRRVESLLAGFWVAEHGVAEQLSPYVAATDGVARECFELQAADERRHARFFDRVAVEVLGITSPARVRELAGREVVDLFEHELPVTADGLRDGRTPLADAVGLYHLVLEGIVLAAGEDALLEEAAGLPGVAVGAARVRADERWHVGLGFQAMTDAGVLAPGVDALARRAVHAWGSPVATPERVERAVATHRRRLRLLQRHAGVAIAHGARS